VGKETIELRRRIDMSKRVAWSTGLLIVLVALSVTGCGPAAQPEENTRVETQVVEVEKTVVVEQTVIVEVEKEVVVTSTPEPAGPYGTMTLGLSSSINTLDPFNFPELNTFNVVHHICEALIYQADDGTPAPGLAVSWENLDDTTWRLKLREGVRFHNGETFDATAVVFSWQYSQQPEILQKWGYSSIDNIEIEDEYTVLITTKSPDPLFTARLMDMGFIVPPKYLEEHGQEYFAEHPVGTGPYKFVEWVKGDHVTLEANTDYWMPSVPKIERLVFVPIPEVSSRVAALEAGQIDLAYRVESQYVPDLLFDPDINVLRFVVPRVYYLGFNTVNLGKGTPIEDERVRQALAYALDVQTIIDRVMEGNATRVNGLVGNNDFGHDDNIEPFPYDPDKAKALLAEAGYPDGFEIDMGGPAGAYSRGKEVCEAAVGYWEDIGVKVNLQMIEGGKYWDDAANRKYPPIFFDSWSTRTGDAQERLEGMLLEDGSYSNYYDPEIESLVKDIGITVDLDAREGMLSELQRLMQEKVPAIGMFEPYGYLATNERVVDYVPRGPETIYLWNTSIRD
jgi:peptide/nickel transport system substrate-binding protein